MAKRESNLDIFMNARIPIVEKSLSPVNLDKWRRMSKDAKYRFIERMIHKGAMI